MNQDKKDNKKKIYEIKVIFNNTLSPEVYRQYLDGVISQNLREQVPPHQQEALLQEFLKAGLIAP